LDRRPQAERQLVHMVLPPDAVPVALGPPPLPESTRAAADPAVEQAIARLLGTATEKRSPLETSTAEPPRPVLREPPRVSRGDHGYALDRAPPGQQLPCRR
jgi:hypothetical protein